MVVYLFNQMVEINGEYPNMVKSCDIIVTLSQPYLHF